MKRKTKIGSGIYSYLESSGLFENGTSSDIEIAKKQYWANRRKELKRQKRQQYKSYAVFLDTKEKRLIESKAKTQHTSITNFVKQAALFLCNRKVVIDKIAYGEIRELFALHYNCIQLLEEEQAVPERIAVQLLKQVEQLETKTLRFIQNV